MNCTTISTLQKLELALGVVWGYRVFAEMFKDRREEKEVQNNILQEKLVFSSLKFHSPVYVEL